MAMPVPVRNTRTHQQSGGIVDVTTRALVVALSFLLSLLAFSLWGVRIQIVGSMLVAVLTLVAAFWGDLFPKRRGTLGRAVAAIMEIFDAETLRWIFVFVVAVAMGFVAYFGVHQLVSPFSGTYANQIAGPCGLGFFFEMLIIVNLLSKPKARIHRTRR